MSLARRPRVLFDISGHGFGHLAQTAPVIARLLARRRPPEVVVRTAIDPRVVRDRLQRGVEVVSHGVDVGMVMAPPNAVRVAASHRAHLAFHARWHETVEREARALERLGASLLVSNVGYRGLAAAAAAGMDSLAFSSLDWARVYGHYCGTLPGARRVRDEMRAAYRSAGSFLSLEPGLARHGLRDVVRVGPIGLRGRRDREGLRARTRAGPHDALVLVSPGGIASRIDLRRWPTTRGVHWIAPAALARRAPGTSAIEETAWPHVDVLASVDAVVTKPGYGTFVDAACNARPLVHALRPDWPEEPRLGRWLARRVPCATVRWSELVDGRLAGALESVLARAPVAPTEPSGIDAVVDAIMARVATA